MNSKINIFKNKYWEIIVLAAIITFLLTSTIQFLEIRSNIGYRRKVKIEMISLTPYLQKIFIPGNIIGGNNFIDTLGIDDSPYKRVLSEHVHWESRIISTKIRLTNRSNKVQSLYYFELGFFINDTTICSSMGYFLDMKTNNFDYHNSNISLQPNEAKNVIIDFQMPLEVIDLTEKENKRLLIESKRLLIENDSLLIEDNWLPIKRLIIGCYNQDKKTIVSKFYTEDEMIEFDNY